MNTPTPPRYATVIRYILILSAHVWRKLEVERGSSRWHLVENSLWKKLWNCRKTDCGKTVLMIRYLGFSVWLLFTRFFRPECCMYFSCHPTRTTCPSYVVSLDFYLLSNVFQVVQIMKLYTARFSQFSF